MDPVSVSVLSATPVKGTRLQTVYEVVLDRAGARGDRQFYVIDGRNRMVNAKQLGELVALVASYSEDDSRLQISFPDEHVVDAEIRLSETIETRFYSEPATARLVDGPWSGALSEYAGQPLRLVQTENGRAVDRGADGGVTLVSSASLRKLADVGGRDEIDARRFRMLIEVDGIDAHTEDAWVGSAVQIGDVRVRFSGHVGRCLITSRDPDTGQIDVPTIDLIGGYRSGLDTTEPLPFGIYGQVLEPGTVRVGDAVTVER